jgi:cation:H+ antiporter
MVLEQLAIFLVSSLLLVKSASYAVRSASKLAIHMKFSEFFVAFFIAGLISIMPELFIGINSALEGAPAIGLGTVIGSNIADLTIVMGIVALAGRRIGVDPKMMKNAFGFIIVTSLPALLMLDGTISRDDGIILIFAFIVHMTNVARSEGIRIFAHRKKAAGNGLWKHSALFVLSMILLFVSSFYIVESAVQISRAFMIPSIIIGLFLVSIGTTLPELTFSLRAVLSKHKEIALGDILGNVAMDCTLSIGIIALISPISSNFSAFATSLLFMILAALLLVTFMRDGKITWQESFAMFFVYAMFAALELKTFLAA